MIDTERLSEQMATSRFAHGRFERFERGKWVPWPVLPIDKLGADEAARVIKCAPKPRRNAE